MRNALFRGAIDDNRGVKGTLRDAAAGELPDLPEADQHTLSAMSYAYAADIVAAERQRRGIVDHVRLNTSQAAHDIAARIIALADREISRIERTRAKEPVNTGAATATAKMAREALALLKDVDALPNAKGDKGNKGNGKQGEPSKPLSLAGRIARDANKEPDDDDEDPTGAEPQGPGDSDDEVNTHTDSARQVGLRAAFPYGA